ncbi:MAG: hypothetical protein QM805_13095 [Pseudomonas sp.]
MAFRIGLTSPAGDLGPLLDRLHAAIENMGSNRAATTAMANLAEAIQGLVHHMRNEQQMIREWVDGQGEQSRDIKTLLEQLTRESERADGDVRRRQWRSHEDAAPIAASNYWPGFVDALSTLILAIVFLLSVFVIVQFFLSQEVTGKDQALARLNAQISQSQRVAVPGKDWENQS